MEAFSIASAVVSVILGIYAIWLSIVFYRISIQASNRMEASSKDLSSSVSRLEKLFDHLYSDTFSMMRDTYSDMRKHVWPESAIDAAAVESQIEIRADGKVDKIRKELLDEVQAVAERAGDTNIKVEQLRNEFSPLIEEAISRSRSAETEAGSEALRDTLIRIAKSAGISGIRAIDLWDQAGQNVKFYAEIRKLKNDGVVSYDVTDSSGTLAANERVYYQDPPAKRERRT